MKLELKHLTPYLPYDLQIEPLYQSMGHMGGFHNKTLDISVLEKYELEEIKPILRPLSDTSKEIEVNGEKFVPYIKLLEQNNFDVKNMNKSDLYGYKDFFKDPDLLMYNDVLKMIEWHFDIFSLIEKGLAVDINTLPQSSE
jgi:hypothetical protein